MEAGADDQGTSSQLLLWAIPTVSAGKTEIGPEPRDHVIDSFANATVAVSPGLWGSTEVGSLALRGGGNGEWGGGGGGKGLLGEITPEFHLEREIGVMKGRWGREREEGGFRPSKAREQRHRGRSASTLPNVTEQDTMGPSLDRPPSPTSSAVAPL